MSPEAGMATPPGHSTTSHKGAVATAEVKGPHRDAAHTGSKGSETVGTARVGSTDVDVGGTDADTAGDKGAAGHAVDGRGRSKVLSTGPV